MKNVGIIFAGGQYGTFLEWCLNYFTDLNFPKELPFTNSGGSHKFEGHHLYDARGCQQYVNSMEDYPFIRFHLRVGSLDKDDANAFKNFKYACENFNKIIFLYPTPTSFAWCINNKFGKVFDSKFLESTSDLYTDLLINWGKEKSFNNIDRWELREFLSIYICDQYVSESSMSLVDKFKKLYNNAIFIPVDAFRDSFESTLRNLISNLDLTLVRTDFLRIWSIWSTCQYHINKDALISNIIEHTLNSTDNFTWDNLTLIDEALIQYYLRIMGINIKCRDLNTFPTDSFTLREILYDVA